MIQIRNTIYKHGVYCVQKPTLLLFTLNSDMHIYIQKILGILRTKRILIYLHYLESDSSVKDDILFLKNQKLILNCVSSIGLRYPWCLQKQILYLILFQQCLHYNETSCYSFSSSIYHVFETNETFLVIGI